LDTIHCFLKNKRLGSKGRKRFSNDNGAIFNQEAHLAVDIPRYRDARRQLPKMPASSGYKSQRRNRTLERKKGGREGECKREKIERVRNSEGEKRKERR